VYLEHPGDDTLSALPLGVGTEGGDEGGAGDNIWLDAQLQHLVKKFHRSWPLAARCARADCCRIRMPCAPNQSMLNGV